MNTNKTMADCITYYITEPQKEAIAELFGKDVNKLEDYEVCEMFDKIIDNALMDAWEGEL